MGLNPFMKRHVERLRRENETARRATEAARRARAEEAPAGRSNSEANAEQLREQEKLPNGFYPAHRSARTNGRPNDV